MPKEEPHFLLASLELSEDLAGSLLSILAVLSKVQVGAQRAPGKLCDSEGWDFTQAPLLCDFLMPFVLGRVPITLTIWTMMSQSSSAMNEGIFLPHTQASLVLLDMQPSSSLSQVYKS